MKKITIEFFKSFYFSVFLLTLIIMKEVIIHKDYSKNFQNWIWILLTINLVAFVCSFFGERFVNYFIRKRIK